MNKLISTDLNGFPFVLDDLRFIDNGIREAFKGSFDALINSSYTNDGFLLDKNKPSTTSPAFIDEATPNFPETFCYINGEIFLISATTLDFTSRSNGDAYCIETDFSFDGDGTKVFEDTNTHETYQIRKAKLTLKLVSTYTTGTDIPVLVFDDSGSNRFVYAQENTYFGRLAYKLNVMDIEFINAVFSGQITSLQNSRNNSESAWTSVSSTTLNSKIYLSSSFLESNYTADVLFNSLSLGISSSSSLRYKKIGRTLFVNISIPYIYLPKWHDMPVRLINIDLSGIISGVTNILPFSSTAMFFHNQANSEMPYQGNVFKVKAHNNRQRSISISGWIPNIGEQFDINKSYDLNIIFPYTATTRTDATSIRYEDINFSFTCEIN